MENNDILEHYKDDILSLEVSKDTSDNLNKAKIFIQSAINKEENLSKEDVVELMKVATEHFNFTENEKLELIEFCKNSYEVTNFERKEKNYQEDILKRADNEATIDRIFPAIDYRPNYGMIYGIKSFDKEGKEQTYIGFSNKKVYEIDSAKNFGIILTHQETIDSKLSLSNFVNYVEGKVVKANDVFNRIKALFEKFVVVQKEFLNVIVCYIMMTYIYVLFQVIPYLWLNGERGTGKSTIMKIMSKLCFNAMFCSNVNPANIFRQIDNDGSTIILDEFEKMYGEDKQEIIKILNQGFNIDGVVPRCVGQNNKIKKFRSFSPKIMGGISNIDDVLFERVIKYTTVKVKDVKITKYREDNNVKRTVDNLVDDLYIFGYIYADQIKNIYDNAEVSFEGYSLREDDLWNPLLCIAKVIDEENQNKEVTDNILKYAKQLSNEKFKRNIENEPKLQLLYALYQYLDSGMLNHLVELNDKRQGVELGELYEYLSEKDELKWIKGTSSLGRYLSQFFGFDKKREVGKENGQPLLNIKKTYYIFNKERILQIMKDNNIKVEDFE